MLSAPPPGQQPIVTPTTRAPLEADAPSLSPHPQVATGQPDALPSTSAPEIITGSKFGVASATGDDEAVSGLQDGRPGQTSVGARDTTVTPVNGDIGPADIGTMCVYHVCAFPLHCCLTASIA